MSSLRKNLRKAAAISLAFVMAVPVSAFAEAGELDELNGILEAQNENAKKSLLEETIDFDTLGSSIKDNGISLAGSLHLTDSSAALLGLSEEIKEGNYFELNTQVDPKQKKWLFEIGLAAEADQPLFDLSAYADENQLGVTIPEFYSGTVGLRSGSLMEQYQGSILEQMMGDLTLESDIDLTFFPDAEDAEGAYSFAGGLNAVIEEGAKALENGATIEKRTEDDQTVYTVVFQKEDLTDLTRAVVEEYNNILSKSGFFNVTDAQEIEETLDASCDMMEVIFKDGLAMDYYVKDNLVTGISFELVMDLTELEEMNQELEALEIDEAAAVAETEMLEGGTEATVLESDPAQIMTLKYDLVYKNPEDPNEGMDLVITGIDGNQEEQMHMTLSCQREITDTTEVNTMNITADADGEAVYDGEIFRSTFDAQTGDFDVWFGVSDEETEMAYVLDSTFSNIQKGKGFDLTIDGLSVVLDGANLGVTGNISISADPGDIATPENIKMVMEMTEEEFISFMTELQVKATIWEQQFETEEETDLGIGMEMEEAPGIDIEIDGTDTPDEIGVEEAAEINIEVDGTDTPDEMGVEEAAEINIEVDETDIPGTEMETAA